MSKAKYAAAKELIADHDYDAARAVLETMPGEPTAERWLGKLPRKRQSRLYGCLGLAVFLAIGFVLGILVDLSPRQQQTMAAVSSPIASDIPGPTPTITETPPPTESPAPTETPVPTMTAEPLIFSGSGDTVLGPVTIPAGLYRATFTTDGFGSVSVAVSSGECGSGTSFLIPGLFNESRGDATNGAEAVFTSRECVTLLEISNVQEPWTLEFELVG